MIVNECKNIFSKELITVFAHGKITHCLTTVWQGSNKDNIYKKMVSGPSISVSPGTWENSNSQTSQQ